MTTPPQSPLFPAPSAGGHGLTRRLPFAKTVVAAGAVVAALSGCASTVNDVECNGDTCSVSAVHYTADKEKEADARALDRAEAYCKARNQKMDLVSLEHGYSPQFEASTLAIIMSTKTVYSFVTFKCVPQ